MTYDPTVGGVILFGGFNCAQGVGYAYTAYSDVWEYGHGEWIQLAPSSPTGFVPDPLITYDPAVLGVLEMSPSACLISNCTSGMDRSNPTWYWGTTPPISNPSVIARGAVDAGTAMNLTASFNGGTAPFSVQWAFGDGQFANGTSVAHTYAQPGNYNVTVWINDSKGYHSDASLEVQVYTASVAFPSASPNPTDVGLGTQFTPGVLGGYPQYSFNWSFGDGNSTAYTCDYPCSSFETSTSHSYSRAGNYEVHLAIFYSNGAVVNESFPIQVHVDPGIISLNGTPNPAVLGQPVTFTSSVTGGTLPYTYSWTFGDGGTGGNLSNITHIYTTNGPFVATLTVRDAAGWGMIDSVDISIALNASVSANATLGAAPLVTGFASEVLGGVPGYTYSWEFGDGGTSATPDPSHVYANPGLYHVSLLVTDAQGHTATAYWGVQVFPGGGTLQLGAEATATTLTVGQTTNITLVPSGGTGNYTVVWTSVPSGCVTISTLILSCTPTQNGTFTVSAEVTDAAGHTAMTYVSYTVGTSNVTYTVTFVETGLPGGTEWSVTLNGQRQNSSTVGIALTEPNGTYTFLIGSVAGYAAAPAAGNLQVSGSSVIEPVEFTPVPPGTYAVIFAEGGLVSGTLWSVTLNGTAKSSVTGYILFAERNGTYSFTIASVTGYSLSPASGTLMVNQGAQPTSVVFTPVTNSPSKGLFGLPSVEGYLVLGGILAVIVVVACVGFYVGRRRRASSGDKTQEGPKMGTQPEPPANQDGPAEAPNPPTEPPPG